MSYDLKTRVEKVIDRTCYVVNGENVSNLVKDLYAELESEIAGFKLIAMQRDAFGTENQRLEQENAGLREQLEFSDGVNIAQRKLYEMGREADEILIKDLYLICDGNDLLAPVFEDKICARLYDFSELSDAQDPAVQKMRKKQALKQALAAKGGDDE